MWGLGDEKEFRSSPLQLAPLCFLSTLTGVNWCQSACPGLKPDLLLIGCVTLDMLLNLSVT